MATNALRMSYDSTSIRNLKQQVLAKQRKLLGKRVESLSEKIRRNDKYDQALESLVQDLRALCHDEQDCLEFDDFIDLFCVWYPHVKWAIKDYIFEERCANRRKVQRLEELSYY